VVAFGCLEEVLISFLRSFFDVFSALRSFDDATSGSTGRRPWLRRFGNFLRDKPRPDTSADLSNFSRLLRHLFINFPLPSSSPTSKFDLPLFRRFFLNEESCDGGELGSADEQKVETIGSSSAGTGATSRCRVLLLRRFVHADDDGLRSMPAGPDEETDIDAPGSASTGASRFKLLPLRRFIKNGEDAELRSEAPWPDGQRDVEASGSDGTGVASRLNLLLLRRFFVKWGGEDAELGSKAGRPNKQREVEASCSNGAAAAARFKLLLLRRLFFAETGGDAEGPSIGSPPTFGTCVSSAVCRTSRLLRLRRNFVGGGCVVASSAVCRTSRLRLRRSFVGVGCVVTSSTSGVGSRCGNISTNASPRKISDDGAATPPKKSASSMPKAKTSLISGREHVSWSSTACLLQRLSGTHLRKSAAKESGGDSAVNLFTSTTNACKNAVRSKSSRPLVAAAAA